MAAPPPLRSGSSRQSRIEAVDHRLTKGQWLQMKTTSRPFGPRTEIEVVPAAVDAEQIEGRAVKVADGGLSATMGYTAENNFDHNSMGITPFFCRKPLSPGAHLELPEPVARHAGARVAPAAGAEIVCSSDGRGGEYMAARAHRRTGGFGAWEANGRIDPRRSPPRPSQAGEKMDYTIQKAVELGVTSPSSRWRAGAASPVVRRDRPGRVAHWQGWRRRPANNAGAIRCRTWRRSSAWKTGWPGRPATPPHAGAGGRLCPEQPAAAGAVQLLVGAEGARSGRSCGPPAGRVSPGEPGPRILRTEMAGLAAWPPCRRFGVISKGLRGGCSNPRNWDTRSIKRAFARRCRSCGRPARRSIRRAAEEEFPVVILVSRVDGSNKGETINLLYSWMDLAISRPWPFDAHRRRSGSALLWRYWRACRPRARSGSFSPVPGIRNPSPRHRGTMRRPNSTSA